MEAANGNGSLYVLESRLRQEVGSLGKRPEETELKRHKRWKQFWSGWTEWSKPLFRCIKPTIKEHSYHGTTAKGKIQHSTKQ
jgi:hypothetical protein